MRVVPSFCAGALLIGACGETPKPKQLTPPDQFFALVENRCLEFADDQWPAANDDEVMPALGAINQGHDVSDPDLWIIEWQESGRLARTDWLKADDSGLRLVQQRYGIHGSDRLRAFDSPYPLIVPYEEDLDAKRQLQSQGIRYTDREVGLVDGQLQSQTVEQGTVDVRVDVLEPVESEASADSSIATRKGFIAERKLLVDYVYRPDGQDTAFEYAERIYFAPETGIVRYHPDMATNCGDPCFYGSFPKSDVGGDTLGLIHAEVLPPESTNCGLPR